MKKRIAWKMVFLHLCFLGGIFAASAQNTAYMLSEEYTNAVRREFYRLVNDHRKANGLQVLEPSKALEKYADIRAAEQRISFGHTRPDGTAAGSGWYNAQNFMNTRFAENAMSVMILDRDPAVTANKLFMGWRNSPGHNAHMLYKFSPHIKMALGIAPELSADGRSVSSGSIWASGYDEFQIIVPNGTTSIGQNFYANSGLTSVSLPNSLTGIGFGAFYGCKELTGVNIPASVSSIGGVAFHLCSKLIKVNFEGTISAGNFSSDRSFPGDLREKYLAGGPGVYVRKEGSESWIKQ